MEEKEGLRLINAGRKAALDEILMYITRVLERDCEDSIKLKHIVKRIKFELKILDIEELI
jgi:hypothetical protein